MNGWFLAGGFEGFFYLSPQGDEIEGFGYEIHGAEQDGVLDRSLVALRAYGDDGDMGGVRHGVYMGGQHQAAYARHHDIHKDHVGNVGGAGRVQEILGLLWAAEGLHLVDGAKHGLVRFQDGLVVVYSYDLQSLFFSHVDILTKIPV